MSKVYGTASEATGCHTQIAAVILLIALLTVVSGRFARGTVPYWRGARCVLREDILKLKSEARH